jgi:hypothetical protein
MTPYAVIIFLLTTPWALMLAVVVTSIIVAAKA